VRRQRQGFAQQEQPLPEVSATDVARESARLLQDTGTTKFYSSGSYGDAIDQYLKAQATLRDANVADTFLEAQLLRNIGLCHMRQERYAEAIALFEQASSLLKAAGEATAARCAEQGAELERYMGICHGHQGAYQAALDLFTSTEAALEAAGATRSAEYTLLLCDMGMCYYCTGRLPEAMAFFSKARAAFEASSATLTSGYAMMLFATGACQYDEGNKAAAATLFSSAKVAFEESGMTGSHSHASLLQALGVCLREEGQSDEAERLLLESQAMLDVDPSVAVSVPRRWHPDDPSSAQADAAVDFTLMSTFSLQPAAVAVAVAAVPRRRFWTLTRRGTS